MPEGRFSDRVFAVVRRIPRGRVASYGLVAELAGAPRAARQVGMVLRLGSGLPWWRVLAKDGRIVIQNPELRFAQHAKLEAEGVRVLDGRVDYERHAWRPKLSQPGRGRGAARARPK
ncbi:MAG TPA: MGMT family protein [Candidatus Thermoplasmatota archaeon]|nr:MGMT family protein [Candidatus Thermoplasmatota archaeon]